MKIINHIAKDESLINKMGSAKRLYGNNVGSKTISILSKLMGKGETPFKWSHEVLGLWKEKTKGIEYL